MKESEKTGTEQLKRWLAILESLAAKKYGSKILGDQGILEYLQDQGFVTFDSEGRQNPTVKTIQRDLTSLEELDYIEAVRNESETKKTGVYKINRYRSEGISKLLKLNLSSDMMLALLLTKDLYKLFEGTELTESINDLYTTVTLAYDGEITPCPIIKKFGPHRHFSELQSSILNDLIFACNEQLLVKATYSQKECTLRPIKLIQYSDAFYLVAQYPNGETPYILHISRFNTVELTVESYETNFDVNSFLNNRLRHSFGISIENEPVEVTLRFTSVVAYMIRERVWHESQKIEEDEQGITLTMNVYPSGELCAWLLGWGKELVGISPESLREKYLGMRG